MAISRRFLFTYIGIVLLIVTFFSFSIVLVHLDEKIKDERKYSFFLQDAILNKSLGKNETSISLSLLETKGNHVEESLPSKNPLKVIQQSPLTVIDYSETPFYVPLSLGYSSTYTKRNFYFPPIKECPQTSHLILTDYGYYKINCSENPIEGIENSYLYPEKLGENSYNYDLIKLKNEQILNKSSEYHLVKCGKNSYDITLKNIKNEKKAEIASGLTESLLKHHKKSSFRPLTVIYYMIDSASRQLIYRNLPETFDYLNSYLSSNKSNYIMYDFKLNNAIKSFTFPNIIPMIYGISYEKFMEYMNKYHNNPQAFKEILKKKSIISQFKKQGFITLVSTDSVNEGIEKIIGKSVDSTHLVNNFFKIARQYFNWDESVDSDACIGPHRPNYYSLEYLLDFMKNYKKMNKFAFIQTNIAHENTGTRLRATDKDFIKFFRDLFKSFDHESEDLVLMLLGDHGNARGDYLTIESLSERAMACHFVLSNKEFIKNLNANEVLLTNTKRLLSRYDWYKSLVLLSYVPYSPVQTDSDQYLNIQTDFKSVNVFSEEAPLSRTCESAGVSQDFCLSRDLTPLQEPELMENPLFFLLETSKTIINSLLSQRPFCGLIEFDEVVGFKFDIDGIGLLKSSNIWIRVSVKGSGEVLLINGVQAGSFYCIEKSNGLFWYSSVLYPENYCVKLEGISRIFPIISGSDKYAQGSCPALMNFDNSLYLNDKQETCSKFCEDLKMECNRPHLYHFVLDEIRKKYNRIEYLGDMDSIEVVDDLVQVGRGRFCENIPENSAVCYCSYLGSEAWEGVFKDNFI